MQKKFSEWEDYFGMWTDYNSKSQSMTGEEFAATIKTVRIIKADTNGEKIEELKSYEK